MSPDEEKAGPTEEPASTNASTHADVGDATTPEGQNPRPRVDPQGAAVHPLASVMYWCDRGHYAGLVCFLEHEAHHQEMVQGILICQSCGMDWADTDLLSDVGWMRVEGRLVRVKRFCVWLCSECGAVPAGRLDG